MAGWKRRMGKDRTMKTLKQIVEEQRENVRLTAEQERGCYNLHLKKAPDFQKGSLGAWIRWEELEMLLNAIEK